MLTWFSLLVLIPLAAVVVAATADGWAGFVETLQNPQTRHALQLTVSTALLVTAINVVMGTVIAWVLVRDRFWGRRLLSLVIDVPFALPTIVAGLVLIALYGSNSPIGITLAQTRWSIFVALLFVTLPFVVRAVQPVLDEIGLEQEQAGRSLGASAWQRLWRLTLPSVRWALAYGVVLSLARALGEFGAVRVVAGNVLGSTQTMPLLAAQRYNDLDENGAFAISFVMVAIAIFCIIVVALLRPSDER